MGRPSAQWLGQYFGRHGEDAANAPAAAGSTRPGAERLPAGFRVRSASRAVDGSFAEAKAAVLAWGCDASSSRSFVARSDGSLMATCAPTYAPRVWVVNPVRETYRLANHAAAAVAYTTVGRHLLQGEERLSVVLRRRGRRLWRRRRNDQLHIEVLSVCRGAGLLGTLVFPFVGPMQRRFFDAQLDFVVDRCAPSSSSLARTRTARPPRSA